MICYFCFLKLEIWNITIKKKDGSLKEFHLSGENVSWKH